MGALYRTIYCSGCGTAWKVPRDMAAGRDVRCKSCLTVFPVPAPISRAPVLAERAKAPPPAHRPTPARLMDVEDFPTDLRAAIAEGPTDPDVRITGQEPPVPAFLRGRGGKKRRMTVAERRLAERRAFDLDAANNPLKRTGAGVLRVPSGALPADEDDPE